MKKQFAVTFIALFGALALSSCGGGWTEEKKTDMKNTCSGLMKINFDDADAVAICDCYINGLVQKFPKAGFTPDQNQAEMDACSANYKSIFDKKMEAQAAAMEAMPKDSLSGTEMAPEGE